MNRIAGVVIARNEERQIAGCLASLAWADERIVLDSGSSDRTAEVVRALGCRLATRPFTNFADQRNAALALTSAEWVFFLDADERVSPALAREIRSATNAAGDVAGFWVPRRNWILGHRMRGGGWWPDDQLRLLRPDRAHYDTTMGVHEVARVDGPTGRLSIPLHHDNYQQLDQLFRKQDLYSRHAAEDLRQRGIRPRPHHYVLQPLRAFRRRFVEWHGYRDGLFGLFLAGLLAWYEFVTYVRAGGRGSGAGGRGVGAGGRGSGAGGEKSGTRGRRPGTLTPTLSPAGERELGASGSFSMDDPAVGAIPRPTPSRSGDRSYGGRWSVVGGQPEDRSHGDDAPDRGNPFNPWTKSADGSTPGDQPVAPTQPSIAGGAGGAEAPGYDQVGQPSAFSLQPSASPSVVIVSWNVCELLANCLVSLRDREPGDRVGEVVVVDNGSRDGTVEMVRARFPEVRLIEAPDNPGFAAANNRGAVETAGDLLLLNPDTVVRPGAIRAMVDALAADSRLGAVGPRLLNGNGTIQSSRRRFPTPLTLFVQSTPLDSWVRCLPGNLAGWFLDDLDWSPRAPDWLVGACLLIRRAAWEATGGLDDGFFMYFEETDWFRRAAALGWRAAFVPDAEVIHLYGKSSEQNLAARQLRFTTSKVRYARRFFGAPFASLLSAYLRLTFAEQAAVEGAKWLIGHKRPLRAQRLDQLGRLIRARWSDDLAQVAR